MTAGAAARTPELFELELIGGAIEKRYRRTRPEVEAMPWGTLDVGALPEDLVTAARKSWTGAAYQEHRTGIACAETLRALMEARAPIDLIAMATRFPLDEMVHAELAARMAMELGGGTEIRYDPSATIGRARLELPPLLRASDLVVRFFCVGEALSIPLLRGTRNAATHPLPRAVLGRIVKDEAAHGAFGWMFLDWVRPELNTAGREFLGRSADDAIDAVRATWAHIRQRPAGAATAVHSLGWMQTDAYLALAEHSLRNGVIDKLRARGIPLQETARP